MKIALFSDIHSNLPALLAVLDDIDSRRPDAVYCLGDLVGYAPWPNEVIAEIRKRHIPVIAGNYDQGIGLESDDCGCAYKTDEEKAMGKISISWTNEIIGKEEREYLRNLPAHVNIEFRRGENKSFNLLLVHGSPRRINEYLFEDRDEKSLLRIMEGASADIMAFGHTHKPYHRVLNIETPEGNRYRHAINTGSVGKPKDGDNRACYVMLSLDESSSMQDAESIGVEFIRVDYDVEKTAVAIEKSPLPDTYADMIRHAY
jgi:predicted phosphodiesterase